MGRLLLDDASFSSLTDTGCEFCVDCGQMLVAIDNPSCAHGSVKVQGNDDSNTVKITIHDPDSPSHEDTTTMATYMDSEDRIEVELDFEYVIEIDLVKLKELIRKARKSHAEHMRISIWLKKTGTATRSLIVYSCEGDHNTTHEQRFCADVVYDPGGAKRTRAMTDGTGTMFDVEGIEPDFSNKYAIGKIEGFLKTVPMRVIVAKVRSDRSILFEHPLNGTTSSDQASYAKFMLAPSYD